MPPDAFCITRWSSPQMVCSPTGPDPDPPPAKAGAAEVMSASTIEAAAATLTFTAPPARSLCLLQTQADLVADAGSRSRERRPPAGRWLSLT